MNDFETRLRGLLEDAAKDAPTMGEGHSREGNVSFSSQLTTGATSRLGWLAATLVAAVVLAILVAPSWMLGDRAEPPMPATPTGSLTVGRNQAVLDLDETWSLDGPSASPTSNRVTVSAGISRLAGVAFPGVSTIDIVAAPTELGPNYTALTGNDLGGYVWVEEVVDTGMILTDLVVPSQDARFLIVTPDRVMAEQVMSSLRELSDDLVAVPNVTSGASGGVPGYSAVPDAAEIRLRLELAGLRAEFESRKSPPDSNPQRTRTSTPAAGAVVPVGTAVHIHD